MVCFSSFNKTHKQSPTRCFVKKVFLQKNTCVGVSFSTSLKQRLRHRCFPVNFGKFLRHLFYRASENSVITVWLTTLRTVVRFPAKFFRTPFYRAFENSVITVWLTTLRTVVRFPWTWISMIILKIKSDEWYLWNEIAIMWVQFAEVTCCIFAHHLPYHKKWIWWKLRQALDIFLHILRFYILSIKFNYAAPFSSLKLLKVGSIRRRTFLTLWQLLWSCEM